MSLSVDDVKKEIGEVKADLATAKDKLAAVETKEVPDRELILMYGGMITKLEERLTGLLESLLPKPCIRHEEWLPSVEQRLTVLESLLPEPSAPSDLKKRRLSSATTLIKVFTDQFRQFQQATKFENCLVSACEFPFNRIRDSRVFVRQCYETLFNFISKAMVQQKKSFAVTGTPGVGKSYFAAYLFYRMLTDWKNFNVVIYHVDSSFYKYDLIGLSVYKTTESDCLKYLIENEEPTLYIIDGANAVPAQCLCCAIFISSPRLGAYKGWVKQEKATEFFLPVWSTEEISACQQECYPNVHNVGEMLEKYGGVARYVFGGNTDVLDGALMDSNAVATIARAGNPTNLFPTSHILLHCIVDSHTLKFKFMDFASFYVQRELWRLHYREMLQNLQQLIRGTPSEIGRHLFEMFGHLSFAIGVKDLPVRCLEDDASEQTLNLEPASRTVYFKKGDIPKCLELRNYYQPEEANFDAIDSLNTAGLYQFTVSSHHPIRGVQVLRQLLTLFSSKPTFYFVVPTKELFDKFKKQDLIVNRKPRECSEIVQCVVLLNVEASNLTPLI